MKLQFEKNLFTHKSSGSLPALVIAENENLQSRFVVQKILELREQGIPLDDIAVLFRSSFHSFDLEIEITKANIPFMKYGGFKFVETSHIKDMTAYLRVLENPLDVVAWNRVLLLIDGVGPRTAEKVIDDILSRKSALSTSSFWGDFNAYGQGIRDVFDMLGSAASQRTSPSEKTSHILNYYYPMFKNRYDDFVKRKKDLEAFEHIAERYSDVSSLLTDLALEPPSESVTDIESPGPETEHLVLSTIHSAKGLEWNSVFIIFALDGRFPSFRAAANAEEMEEERRLMYVACTRAKENLFITYPVNVYDRESGLILSKPSRFLEGMKDRLLEPWIIDEEPAGE